MAPRGFELLCQIDLVDLIGIEKYRSLRTGLTVCIANVAGPLVNGYFCLGKIKTLLCTAHPQPDLAELGLAVFTRAIVFSSIRII